MEIKQHDLENPMGQRRNQREISRNILRQMKIETTCQILWDAASTVLRGKFIMIKAYINKQEKPQVKKT